MKKALILLILIFMHVPAMAQEILDVKISGNQRVETESVKSYLSVKTGEEYSAQNLNESIKALYATGLFSDVNAAEQGGIVFIKVTENPSISQVAFEGNRALDDEQLKSEITLDSRSVYTKSEVQKAVQRIAALYKKSGRFSAKVDPQVILKDQNRVDLVFEIDEGSTTEINRIIFIGNEAFDDSDLRSQVRSSEYAWYNLLSSDDVYDADRIEYDKELLRRFYTSNGYAGFKVNAAVAELTPDVGGFVVTFSIDEGDFYRFGKSQVITQLDEIDPSKFEEDTVRSELGKYYDATKVEKTVDNLTSLAGSKGYAFVEVNPQVSRDEEANIIDVTYVMSEGPKVYVDRIDITGNVRTLDKVVRREMKLSEGDPFNTNFLARSKQRIDNLGFFKKVEVTQTKSNAPDKVNIGVKVAEQSTGEINFGAGFSSTDGVLGEVSVTERNLLGRGQKLRASITASGVRQNGVISFTEPYLFGRNVAGGFSLFSTQTDFESESSFKNESLGANFTMAYEITEHLRHSLNYSIDSQEITDVAATASSFIRRQEGKAVTSLVGHDLTYDTRDNNRDPGEGLLLRFGQDIAGLGGDNKFLRHEATAVYYYPLSEKKDWKMIFSADVGNIVGIGEDVPINQRFFIGGKDFRGFDRSGLGPRDSATNDALGGDNFYVLSAELGFPLGISDEYGFTGALFADYGSLWGLDDSGVGVVDNADPRLTIGVGLGWSSPFGPLRLDFGFPIIKDDVDETQSFQFNFGTRF